MLKLSDRDWICLCFSICSLSVPLFSTTKFQFSRSVKNKEILIAIGFSIIIPIAILVVKSSSSIGKTAIVSGSAWAKFDKKLNSLTLDKIDISYMYSYSELQELLQADSIMLQEIVNLKTQSNNQGGEEYKEIWIITPTMNISEEQSSALLKWIENGGKLIIITDHTDLFGHATVLNALLSKIGLETASDAFFPVDPLEKAQTSLNFNYLLKTANTQSGTLLWPIMTARWVSEPVDYSNRNFFGPMRGTGTAKFGRRVIAGEYSHGKGRLIVFGDSTIFANFAIYQPGYIDFLEFLRTPKISSALYCYFLMLLAFGWAICFIFNQKKLFSLFPLIGLWCISDLQTIPIKWPEHIICSGNPESLSELTNPQYSFSTAYSLIPLSDKKPKWVHKPQNSDCGLWFGETPPPNKKWKWISHQIDSDNIEKEIGLSKLLSYLTSVNPSTNYSIESNDHIKAGNLWTNDCMGEWWLDHGISRTKKIRFSKWLQEISPLQQLEIDPCINEVDLGDQYKLYKFKYDKEDWISISLPEIKFHGKSEVYLGYGVSAKVITLNGKEMLVGTKSLTEGWQVPLSWILIPCDE